ncbi:MAG TPA: response regulator transcription factor [Anaerolineae bacterium]
MILLLVAAAYPLIREGLKALVRDASDISLVGEAGTGHETLERAIELDPHVILLDADLLAREGVDLLRDLRQSLPDSAVLIVTAQDNPPLAQNALAQGARGYLPRTLSANEMALAIRSAARGLVVVHHSLASELFDPQRMLAPRADDLLEPLTARELEVLAWLTRGLANKQIALELSITEHTVKFHIRSILAKLGVSNRTEAVSTALQRGLVTM